MPAADDLHRTVFVKEAVEQLKPRPGGRYIDSTLGAGGHTKALLEKAADIQVLGIDRDQEALEAARERLEAYRSQVHLVRGGFSRLTDYAEDIGWETVDGVIWDFGLSSIQIDRANRGFSYAADGPLDMRMDRRQRLTASLLLNTAAVEELTRIFREFGEEPRARQLARAIVKRRVDSPWERTAELADLIQRVAGDRRTRRRQAEARCFQALRIAVNDELQEIEASLEAAIGLLRPGGRLAAISFHSLEDRIVKQKLVYEVKTCICPPGLPACRCGKTARLKILTKRPLTPTAAEVAANRRASSAKLRAAERTAE